MNLAPTRKLAPRCHAHAWLHGCGTFASRACTDARTEAVSKEEMQLGRHLLPELKNILSAEREETSIGEYFKSHLIRLKPRIRRDFKASSLDLIRSPG